MTDSLEKRTEEEATSESSESSGNQTGVQSGQYVTVEQFQQLNQAIENLRRNMQSTKDKGIKQVAERLDGVEGTLKDVLQHAAQKGQSISDVIEQLDAEEEREFRNSLREMTQAFKSGQFPTGSGGTGQSQGVDVQSVLSELELDVNDTRVQAFRSRQFASEAELYKEAAKLARQISTTQPRDSDQPSPGGRRQASPTGQDALRQEYQERSKNLYGRRLLLLKQEMRQKGLEIS